MSITVSAMYVYPVKGCRGVPVSEAEVGPRGLAGDRLWMWVDADGRFLSQRSHPQMAQVDTEIIEGGVKLSAPGIGAVSVSAPAGDGLKRTVQVWSSTLEALVAPEAEAWGKALFGVEAHLVHLGEGCKRPLKPSRGQPGDEVSFADGYPVLLASEASLAALNGWIAETGRDPVPMARFRPNVVITGEIEPFAEDEWPVLELGGVRFQGGAPCERCTVTTLDQQTGQKHDGEPLITLARHRRWDNKVFFGVNLVPRAYGMLRRGDACVLN
ncbi:MAG: MOSC domain-containing protein [Bradymonadia bacterium]